MKPLSSRPGYVFLIATLFIGTVAAATVVILLQMGLSGERSGFALQQSTQALAAADTCFERALESLRSDLSYAGNSSYTLPEGSCRILVITGTGVSNRTVCVEGTTGPSSRRLEITLLSIFPTTVVYSWQEVVQFSLCS